MALVGTSIVVAQRSGVEKAMFLTGVDRAWGGQLEEEAATSKWVEELEELVKVFVAAGDTAHARRAASILERRGFGTAEQVIQRVTDRLVSGG